MKDINYKILRKRFIYLYTCGILLPILLLIALLSESIGELLFPNLFHASNITQYVLSLLSFFLIFVILYFAFSIIPIKRQYERELNYKQWLALFFFCVILASLAFLYRRFVGEIDDFGVYIYDITIHTIPVELGFGLFVISTLVSIAFFTKRIKDIPNTVLFFSYFIIILAVFITGFYPNFFASDVYHGVAYTESIYNVYYATPYNILTTGIYGHYGIIIGLLMRVFNGHYLFLAVCNAIINVFVCLLCMYCIHNIVKENYFRLFAILSCCSTVLAMRILNYSQLQPQRVLFPLIIVAYVLNITKKYKYISFSKILMGYAICSLSILWNTEGGIICSIAFASACMINTWQSDRWYDHKSWMQILFHILLIICSLLIAIFAVNIYNYCCGYNNIEINSFFFPLFESGFMTEILEYDAEISNIAWLSIFGTLLAGVLVALYRTSFFFSEKEIDKDNDSVRLAPVLMVTCFLGLGNFTYYVNRAAYLNLDIEVQLITIVISIFWRLYSHSYETADKRLTLKSCLNAQYAFVSLLIIAGLAVQTIVFTPYNINIKYQTGIYNTQKLDEIADEVEHLIPENTLIIGMGSSVIYNELDWDTKAHYRDIPDIINVGSEMNKVCDELSDQVAAEDSFAVFSGFVNDYEKSIVDYINNKHQDTFELEMETFIDGRYALKYFVKNK